MLHLQQSADRWTVLATTGDFSFIRRYSSSCAHTGCWRGRLCTIAWPLPSEVDRNLSDRIRIQKQMIYPPREKWGNKLVEDKLFHPGLSISVDTLEKQKVKYAELTELRLEFDQWDKFLMLSRLIYKPVKFSLDLTAVLKDDYLRQIKIILYRFNWDQA